MRAGELACFRDDGVMLPVEGHPGVIQCNVCGFVTKLIDFEPNEIAALFHQEIAEKTAISKKGGAKKGRRRSSRKAKGLPWYMTERE